MGSYKKLAKWHLAFETRPNTMAHHQSDFIVIPVVQTPKFYDNDLFSAKAGFQIAENITTLNNCACISIPYC